MERHIKTLEALAARLLLHAERSQSYADEARDPSLAKQFYLLSKEGLDDVRALEAACMAMRLAIWQEQRGVIPPKSDAQADLPL